MSANTFGSLGSAIRAIKRDVGARDRRCRNAVRKAARTTASYVVRTVPRGFADLANSIHVEDVAAGESHVIADAPHAAAVEVGSRPHTPPIEPLIAWVTLRGMQGLTAGGAIAKGRTKEGRFTAGSSDAKYAAARSIATSIRTMKTRKQAADWRAATAAAGQLGQMDADPAILKIARSIQQAIAKRGTKPHRYMFAAIPQAEDALSDYVDAALPDR